ncbi:MAG TPA: ADP-ribosylation factor-like protein [Thermoanaerobaculia bacterium]|nr:ADP-ribosylation factor-like protein [Thermoanaerobaculia bacterium]
MVLFNHSTRELTAKIVYYGPGLCGKTTNLRLLHEKLEQGTTGRLLSLSTAQDRTIYFDLLPVELGNVKGYTVRFQLCTVPGQVFYNETRKLVLRGVDGIVFVVDSQWSMLSHNLESFQNLRENMAELDQTFDETAVVIQYNKRDLPGVLSVQALQESLGFQDYPFVEAVAASGKGVVETFKLVSKMTFVQLLRRLQRSPDGEKLGPEWVAPPSEDASRTTRIPAVGAELLALTSTVGPAPAPPTESPFETTASWPSMPRGEVFGDATVPPQPGLPPAPAPTDVPFEPAPLPDSADDTLTDGPPVTAVAEVARAESPAPPEPPEPESSSLPEPTEGPGPEVAAPEAPAAPEPLAVPPPAPEAEPPSLLVAAPPPPPPQPEPPPAAAVWAEAFAALSSRIDGLASARSEETARLETLIREGRELLEERLDGIQAPIERSLDGLAASLEERFSALERAFGSRIEELRTVLEARLGVLEDAVARLESSDRLEEVRRETADVKRLVESKLDEAGGQSRRLGAFLRRALDELEPPAGD